MDSKLSIGYCLLTSGHCDLADEGEHGSAQNFKTWSGGHDEHLPMLLKSLPFSK